MKKLQLSKVSNMLSVHGGGPWQTQLGNGDNDCMFPEDASKPADHGIKTPTQ